ncbi:hypothetical protein GLYMA_04G183350v4 [Glycine max]|nr:hypothetical protein GLYMA_04G183350v4 [Glycine max]
MSLCGILLYFSIASFQSSILFPTNVEPMTTKANAWKV